MSSCVGRSDGGCKVRDGAAAIVLALIAFAAMSPWLGSSAALSTDSVTYLRTAQSYLGHAQGDDLTRSVPPGLPAVLALDQCVGRDPVMDGPWLNAAAHAISVVFSFFLVRMFVALSWALVAGLLVAVNSISIQRGGYLLTEPLYAAMGVVAVYFGQRFVQHRRRAGCAGWSAGAAGVATVLTTFVRWNGILLLPAILWAEWRQHCTVAGNAGPLNAAACRADGNGIAEEIDMAALSGKARTWTSVWIPRVLLVVLVVAPVLAFKMQASAPVSNDLYLPYLVRGQGVQPDTRPVPGYIDRVKEFGPLRLREIKQFILPSRLLWRTLQSPLDAATTWFVGGVVLAILILGAIRHARIGDTYVLLSLGLLVMWPWDENGRLTAPLIPLVIVSIVITASAIARSRRGSATRHLGGAVVLGLLLLQGADLCVSWPRLLDQRARIAERNDESKALGEWLSAHTESQTRISALSPDGDVSKVTAYLAAFLSHRDVRLVDVMENQLANAVSRAAADSDWLLVAGDAVSVRAVLPQSYVWTAELAGFQMLHREGKAAQPQAD